MIGLILFYLVAVQRFSVGSAENDTEPNLRIVGGNTANILNYPYQLALLKEGSYWCSASILSRNFALTAAQCTYQLWPYQVSFRAGSSDRTLGGQVVRATGIYQHPKFNPETLDYDVALVSVSPYFGFNSVTRNIGIAYIKPWSGNLATATGWGTISEQSYYLPFYLRYVRAPIVSTATCQTNYQNVLTVTDRMICAGYTYGGKGICKGDAGAPLAIQDRLVGVASWGYGCARAYAPAVYANVQNSEIRSFIRTFAGV